jgi:hypothetical protein
LGVGGIPQGIAERPKRGAGLADTVDQVEQFAGSSAESIQLGHDRAFSAVMSLAMNRRAN